MKDIRFGHDHRLFSSLDAIKRQLLKEIRYAKQKVKQEGVSVRQRVQN